MSNRDERVDAFIEKNGIHLKMSADFDWSKLKKHSKDKEKTNAKIIMSHSIGNYLVDDKRVDKYLSHIEIPEHPDMEALQFNCYVFSGGQLRAFIEKVAETPKFSLTNLN